MSITTKLLDACPYCAPITTHAGLCPRIAAIEYHPNGSIARVVFHPAAPIPVNEEGST